MTRKWWDEAVLMNDERDTVLASLTESFDLAKEESGIGTAYLGLERSID